MRETVERWIRRQFTDPVLTQEGSRRCVAISLCHFKAGIRNEIQTIPLGSKEWEPKQLADLLNTLADECAQGISPDESGSGYEQFEVVSFFSDIPDQPVGRCPINRRTGLLGRDAGSVASEAPDTRGLTKQDMRHKEAWMQFTLDATARSNAAMLSVIDSLSKRNAQLERENYDAIDLAKEMIFEKAASTHAFEMAEKEYERKTEERRRLLAIAPAAVNQLLGKDIFPASAVDSTLLETFVEGLSEHGAEEVLAVLSKHMKPDVAAMLIGRFAEIQEQINKRKAAEQAKEKRNGTPS